MDVYSQAKTKLKKAMIVSQIIDAVRQARPVGGFLSEEDGEWVKEGDAVAREKVGQGKVPIVAPFDVLSTTHFKGSMSHTRHFLSPQTRFRDLLHTKCCSNADMDV
jgi:hypothetical protein